MGNMVFHRSERTCYTVVDNTILRDKRLSAKAKGVFVYILSLPQDWELYMEELANNFSDGMSAIKSALKELEQYGYIKKTRGKNQKGQYSANIFEVIERPDIQKPSIENPPMENPPMEKPLTENQPLLNTYIQSTNKLNTEKIRTNKDLPSTKTTAKAVGETPAENRTQKTITDKYCEVYEKVYGQPFKPVSKDFWVRTSRMIKSQLQRFSIEQLCSAIDMAKNDNWVISKGFDINIILSTNMVERYLNPNYSTKATPQKDARSESYNWDKI